MEFHVSNCKGNKIFSPNNYFYIILPTAKVDIKSGIYT
jgi:hypothetical protein